MINRVDEILNSIDADREFRPYVEYNEEADAVTAYFSSDADFSRRLTDHVTLYLSLESREIVGCRIKGVRDILDNLPNYLTVDHGELRLSVLFLPYYSSVSGEDREALNKLANASKGLPLPVGCAKE